MLVINGRIFIDVKIDQKSLDNAPDVFDTLILTESIVGLFPGASLTLNDYSGQLGKQLALTEGNEILVTVGRSPSDMNTISRQYRMYQPKTEASAFGPQIKVSCIYDAPKYISEAAIEYYSGTSSQVLQKIADKCNLYYCGPEKYNGRSMNDNQKWWNINRSRAMFAQQNVARHGYQDPHSAMCSALTSMGELRYRNLMDVIERPLDQIKYLFSQSSPLSDEDKKRHTFLVDAARGYSDAGLINNWQNYGSTRIVHSQSGVEEIEESVDVKTSGKYLAINDQVSKTIGRARYDHSLLDCGNVSDRYERAFYQNVKQLGLFSERLSILVSESTPVQLLDAVLYRESFMDQKDTSNTSDVYIVIGKTIYVKGGQYYAERIELARMSLTEKGESALKCAPTPDQAAKDAIPEASIDVTAMSTPTTPGVAAKQLDKVKEIQADAKAVDAAAKTAKTDSLKVAKATVNIVRSAIKLAAIFKAGAAGIKGNPQNALSVLSDATGSLLNYNKVVGGFSNSYAQAGVSYLEYANKRLTDPKFNEAVRVATLLKPGGLASNQAAIAGAVALNKKTNEIFNSGASVYSSGEAIAALRKEPGGTQALDTFNARIDEMNDNTQKINSGVTNMWNGSLSLATGKPVPPSLAAQPESSASLYSFVGGSLAQPSTYESKVKPPDDVKADFMSRLFRKTDNSWVDPDTFQAYTTQVPIDRTSSNMSWGELSAPQSPEEVELSAQELEDKAKAYQAQQALSYV